MLSRPEHFYGDVGFPFQYDSFHYTKILKITKTVNGSEANTSHSFPKRTAYHSNMEMERFVVVVVTCAGTCQRSVTSVPTSSCKTKDYSSKKGGHLFEGVGLWAPI